MKRESISGEEFHRRVRQGQAEKHRVVSELFQLHYTKLVGRFVYKGLPLRLAEEHASEVFVKFLLHCETLSPSTPPIHWLNRVVSNMICDHYLAQRRTGGSLPKEEDDEQEVSGDDPPAGDPGNLWIRDVVNSGERGLPSSFDPPDPDPATSPEAAMSRRQNCAVKAWQSFESQFPLESELLAALALDEIDMKQLQATLEARSPQAARQRVYTWRRKLREFCLAFCGNEECAASGD